MMEEEINKLLNSLKQQLEPVQDRINNQFVKPKFPIISIIGSPRSGTTLLLQYLSASGIFSYPSNLITRFAYAPYVGCQIQQLLYDDKFGMDLQQKELFISDLGKSSGSLGVNEFYHFWRRFIPLFFPQYINKIDFDKIDFEKIFKELASIESVFNKPFVCKGMMLQYNLQDLKKNAEPFIFLRIKRKAEFVMQSIFLAREKYYSDINTWWSLKPKEYEQLKEMDIYHQIAGQVYYTEKAIEDGLKTINEDQQITIQYEKFCEQPNDILNLILNNHSFLNNNNNLDLPNRFDISNNIQINRKDFEALKEAYQNFERKNI